MKIVFKNFIFLDDMEIKEILNLRNLDYVRKNMINDEVISLENHKSFIASLKNQNFKKYFALFEDDKIVGSLNFVKNDNLTWGLYFKDEVNPIIKACATFLFLDYIFSFFEDDINSFVKKSNTNALSFNKNFGFEVLKEDKKFFYLKLSKKAWQEQKNLKLLKPIKKYLDKIEHNFID